VIVVPRLKLSCRKYHIGGSHHSQALYVHKGSIISFTRVLFNSQSVNPSKNRHKSKSMKVVVMEKLAETQELDIDHTNKKVIEKISCKYQ
jgi:hypothetical protein